MSSVAYNQEVSIQEISINDILFPFMQLGESDLGSAFATSSESFDNYQGDTNWKRYVDWKTLFMFGLFSKPKTSSVHTHIISLDYANNTLGGGTMRDIIDEITWENTKFKLRRKIILDIQYEDGYYSAFFEPLDIMLCTKDKDDVKTSFYEEFAYLWKSYVLEDENRLTRDAKMLRRNLQESVLEVITNGNYEGIRH